MMTTMTRRGATAVFDFGPGRMEGLSLRVWAVPGFDGRRHKARLTGWFEADCGYTQHRVDIDIRDDQWVGPGSDLQRAAEGDVNEAADVADDLLSDAMYDWSCDCDTSCVWTSEDECMMAAERLVAGTPEPQPVCAVHVA